MENIIFGIHPLLEALEEGRKPEKVFIQKGLTGNSFQKLFHKIRAENIPFQMVPVERLNRITRKNHQGVVAQIALIEYHKLEDVLPPIYENGEVPLLVILDRITDVRNFGAIARTAEVAGAHAIIVPEKDSAPVNADAIKTSSGALSRIPVCREKELLATIAFLNHSGIKVIACTEKSRSVLYDIKLDVPLAVVMGSEEKGVSKSTLAAVDLTVAIPQKGKIGSLNVSVATGIVLFEALRQRKSF
ncbi:MAG: 23S rRNA (guanosine(2251)-2'-O)-methyltransferase RlmB [Bacteroidales bacterium]